MRREDGGSPSLTPEMASLIKGMLRRGDSHASIARFFGVNMGRVADIKFQRRFPYVPETPLDLLPPRQPIKTPYEEWKEAHEEINRIVYALLKAAMPPRRRKKLPSTASKQLTLKI